MEILILVLLVAVNGIFAMSEMAVVSSRKARLQQWADENRPGARVALLLANEPSAFLSTVQIGISVIAITSGAFGEARLTSDLAAWLAQWPLFARHADVIADTVVIACITLASVIVGELVPKRLALVNPEAVATFVARPMHLLAAIAHPVVRLLTAITEGALRIVGVADRAHPPVSEEEIKVLMEQGAEAGVFEAHEQALVTRVFHLDQLRVPGIMTPRSEIEYIDLDEDAAAVAARITRSGHSRFPVVRGGLDRIVGVVRAKSLLDDAVAGRVPDVARHAAAPLYVPETLTVMQLIESFRAHRATLALVRNEYGTCRGLVTLGDVLEAMVGEIATVEHVHELDVVRRGDGSWLVDGTVTIERLKDVLEIREALPDEEEDFYDTVGGFVVTQLGRIPQPADGFEWNGIRFEVMDMDGHRVDKVLVSRPLVPAVDASPPELPRAG